MMKTFYLLMAVWGLVLAGCSQHREGASVAPKSEPSVSETLVKEQTGRLRTRTTRQLPTAGSASAVAAQPVEVKQPVHYTMPGRRVSRVAVPGKYVALTFDDGPSASLTPKVLDILKRHQARGTFFVLGENASRNKAIIARAAAEGNEIASHSWNHPNLARIGMGQVRSQVERTNAVIESATGRRPALLRPPYGATNKGIVDALYNEYGLTSVLWDVDTRDWQHPGVDVVISRAVGQAKPGSIILVHDIHASTLAAVEGIVTGLQGRGFRLVTVSELLALGRRAASAQAEPAAAPMVPSAPAAAAPVAPAVSPAAPVAGEGQEEAAPIPVPVAASVVAPAVQSGAPGAASVGTAVPVEERDAWLHPAAGGASISGASATEGE